MKKVIFALILFFMADKMAAQESQTAYNFLRLSVSAHAAALGGDNITLINDDAWLMFNNPALLSSVSDKTLALNYMNFMRGVNLAGVAYNKVVKERASAALSVNYVDYGKMRYTTADNQDLGEFAARDIAATAYFSYMLTDKLAGGIAAKVLSSSIGHYTSIGMGVDLGLNYYDSERELSLSVVAKNLGGQLKAYEDDYEAMPIDVQMGISKRLQHTPFCLSATLVDLNHWHYALMKHFVFGVDVDLSPNIWVGAGYSLRRANEMKVGDAENASSHGAGLSLGAGLQLERFKLNLAYGKYHVSSSSVVLNVSFAM